MYKYLIMQTIVLREKKLNQDFEGPESIPE